ASLIARYAVPSLTFKSFAICLTDILLPTFRDIICWIICSCFVATICSPTFNCTSLYIYSILYSCFTGSSIVTGSLSLFFFLFHYRWRGDLQKCSKVSSHNK